MKNSSGFAKAQENLGRNSKVEFTVGLRKIVEWYKK